MGSLFLLPLKVNQEPSGFLCRNYRGCHYVEAIILEMSVSSAAEHQDNDKGITIHTPHPTSDGNIHPVSQYALSALLST